MTDTCKQTLWRHHARLGWRGLSILAVAIGLSLSACGDDSGAETPAEPNVSDITTVAPEDAPTDDVPSQGAATSAPAIATASVADADGKSLGEVTFTEEDGFLKVSATMEGMEPGFYGFHIHEIGECEPDSAAPDDPSDTGAFKSAGGHIAGQEGAQHPQHAGDLPTLLVAEDGTADMSVFTDRLNESLLLDDDGSSVMIHAKPDNFANIPERYAPDGPDSDTTGAGDAGERLACGVVGE